MKNFNEIYEEVYNECNAELEEKRIEVRNRNIRVLVICAMIPIIIFILTRNIFTIGYLFALFVVSSVILLVFSKKAREYNSLFKNKVIKNFIKAYSSTLDYFPERGMNPINYREAEFEGYDRYSSEDYIVGKLEDGNEIEMAEVLTEYESTDDDGHTTYTTIFHGLFARIALTKQVEDTIRIRRNRKIKLFNKKYLIEMDSAEFEKIYDVYSENKIVTMQLLTADIMQMFIDFKNEYKITPELTLKGNNMYIRFATGNLFEANIMKEALDYKTLGKYYDTINFTLGITEKMLKNIKETEI